MDLKPANSIDSDLLGNPIDSLSDCKALYSVNDPVAPPTIELLDSENKESSKPMIKDLSRL